MESLGELAKNQLQVYKGRDGNKKQLTITTETISFLETSFPELKNKISYLTTNYMQLKTKNQYG
jgi:hypothetical protein